MASSSDVSNEQEYSTAASRASPTTDQPTSARTVLEYDSVKSLREALQDSSKRGHIQSREGSDCSWRSHICPQFDYDDKCSDKAYDGKMSRQEMSPQNPLSSKLDWITENLDLETCQPQSIEEELNRLVVLRSYLILDSDREESFERITALAARFFNAPIAPISLVDLGRQWYKSNRGLGGALETPRKLSFCAHAIQSIEDLMVIPDASRDHRFVNNALVTGPPHIRFYAGAPLICPEGYKLGTLCIIDREPRPDGLCLSQKQTLRELAALVVETMVQRRSARLIPSSAKAQSRIAACLAHDMLTPLDALKSSLSQVTTRGGDRGKGKNTSQESLVQTANSCLDVLSRMCHQSIHQYQVELDTKTPTSNLAKEGFPLQSPTIHSPKGECDDDDNDGYDDGKGITPSNNGSWGTVGVVEIATLVATLRTVMEEHPKLVPLVITIDPKVPKEIISDDSKLFKCALNYLTNALEHTQTGSVQFRIYAKEVKNMEMGIDSSAGGVLVFVCEDTGPGVCVDIYQDLFMPIRRNRNGSDDRHGVPPVARSGLGLQSVANNISSLGGQYGFHPRKVEKDASRGHSSTAGDTGSTFWFSVPLVVPYSPPSAAKEKERAQSVGDSNDMPLSRSSSFNSTKQPKLKMLSLSNVTEYDSKKVYDIVAGTVDAKDRGLEVSFQQDEASACSSSNTGRPKDDQAGGRAKRALIIDDSVVIRKSIGRALENLGFDVTVATNGFEGLRMLQSSLFDVILCDFLMPVMDGPDCVKRYRSWEADQRPSCQQHIIGLSAHDSDEDVKRGIEAGMNDFIPKSKLLKEILERAINICNMSNGEIKEEQETKNKASKTRERRTSHSRYEPEDGTDWTSSRLASSVANLPVSSLALHPELFPSFTDKRTPSGRGVSPADSYLRFDGKLSSLSCGQTAKTSSIPSPLNLDLPPPPLECLIAEDSMTNLNVLMKAVETKGWRSRVVHDGDEALRVLKSKLWDAVFLDEDLPDLAGAACVARFRVWENVFPRRAHQGNVFLISGHFSSQNSVEGRTVMHPSGFDGCLGKPINRKDVEGLLDRAARR